VQLAGSRNFFGYPETKGTDNFCGMQNLDREKPGYYAPPLYGVWSTAPYFHNGSVPNLWEVLKSSDRKLFWERVSRPARSDQEGLVTMGFDTDLERAFDHEKVGWKYEALSCTAEDGLNPGLNCNPEEPTQPTLTQELLDALYANVIGAWNILYPPIVSDEQVENRKIYNTREFGAGNEGHTFTDVLTDQERLAILEYLKTL